MTPYDFLARLSYDRETGKFTALKRSGRRSAGAELGYTRPDGYRMLSVAGRWYYAHRLAWFLCTGSWPAEEIDHINGDRADNRIANLRECTRSENMRNTPKKGVCFHKTQRKWLASIRLNGKREHLGSFNAEQEALAAYQEAADRLHGEFAFVSAPKPGEPKQEAFL